MSTVKSKEQLHAEWDSIFENAADVDPDDHYCWESLAFGWALGQGLSVDEAHEFLAEIDY